MCIPMAYSIKVCINRHPSKRESHSADHKKCSTDGTLEILLTRLAQVEKDLGLLAPPSSVRNVQDDTISSVESPRPQVPVAILSPSITPGPPGYFPTGWQGENRQETISDVSTTSKATRISLSDLEAMHSLNSLRIQDHTTRANYLDKTPLACEASRSPLPDLLLLESQPVRLSEIPLFVKYFLENPGTLFPIPCGHSIEDISSSVAVQGLRDDIYSCLALVIFALAQAYTDGAVLQSGLLDFQRVTYLLNRISTQISMEYVQTQIFCALFLLKKGRMLNFWSALHASCGSLYSLIKRYERSPEIIILLLLANLEHVAEHKVARLK